MVVYQQGHRPWLSLYNVHVQVPILSSCGVRITTPVQAQLWERKAITKNERSALSQAEPDALAPIQQCLSQELMTIVFSTLDPYSLARAAVVCRQWRCVSEVGREMGQPLFPRAQRCCSSCTAAR